MKLSKEVDLNAVRWESLAEALTKRYKLPPELAKGWIDDFRRRSSTLFAIYWFRHSGISAPDNHLVACLCEMNGADTVTIVDERSVSLPGGPLSYRQTLEFTPELRRLELPGFKGKLIPEISLRWGRWRYRIHSIQQAVLCYVVFGFLGIVSYVLLAGLCLYGVAVLLLFIYEPQNVLFAVSRRGSMGFAFLAFLVGVAGIFGKAVRNILALLRGGAIKPSKEYRPPR